MALSPRGAGLDIMVFRRSEVGKPLLLVSAPRKTGGAVERNKFRRRVRMALLAVLRKRSVSSEYGFTLWVRPAKGNPCGCRLCYRDIEKQIEASLGRLGHQ